MKELTLPIRFFEVAVAVGLSAMVVGGAALYKTEKLVPRWDRIIIHHSGTVTGGAEAFGKYHKSLGWNGLGYHFVIGNGTQTPDGAIEIGHRWAKQIDGAHCKGYNNRSIGICLVGNFETSKPSRRQLISLSFLLECLSARYAIPQARIFGHNRLGQTKCPGKYLTIQQFMEICNDKSK